MERCECPATSLLALASEHVVLYTEFKQWKGKEYRRMMALTHINQGGPVQLFGEWRRTVTYAAKSLHAQIVGYTLATG